MQFIQPGKEKNDTTFTRDTTLDFHTRTWRSRPVQKNLLQHVEDIYSSGTDKIKSTDVSNKNTLLQLLSSAEIQKLENEIRYSLPADLKNYFQLTAQCLWGTVTSRCNSLTTSWFATKTSQIQATPCTGHITVNNNYIVPLSP